MHTPFKSRGRALAPMLVLLAVLGAALLGPSTAAAIRDASYNEAHQLRLEERLTRRAQHQSEREAKRSEREARRNERAQRRAARKLARQERRGEREGAGSGEAEAPGGRSVAAACQVTIAAAPVRVLAGQSVELSGSVTCPADLATPVAPVEIRERVAGSGLRTAVLARTLAAADDGSFSTTAGPLTANTVFQATLGGAQTRIAVKVAPAVTLSASPAPEAVRPAGATARTRRTKTRFSGSVTPAVPGALVALQVTSATSGRWRSIGWTHTDIDGAYSIERVLHSAGAETVRTLVHPRRHLSVGLSEQLSLQGLQAQRPALTIGTSADPAVDGHAVQISGVAAAGPGVAVKLLGRAAGGSWTVLGETTTDQAGGYSFEQTPPETTSYRVAEATSASTVLKQRVAFALAPEPTGSTATAGDAVVFTGTVAHASSGTPVVLEALAATGLNFHPLATGTVGPAQEYSIAHAFPAGVYTLRLRVPGDTAHSAAAGSPFALTVTP